jgi:hypothetical protein
MKQKAASEHIDYTVVVEILLLNFEAIESHYVLLTMLSALTRANKSLGRRILWNETIWNRLANSIEFFSPGGQENITLQIKDFYNLTLGDHARLFNFRGRYNGKFANYILYIICRIADLDGLFLPGVLTALKARHVSMSLDRFLVGCKGLAAMNSTADFLRAVLHIITHMEITADDLLRIGLRKSISQISRLLDEDPLALCNVEKSLLSTLHKEALPMVERLGPYKMDNMSDGIIVLETVSLYDMAPLPRSYNLYFRLTEDIFPCGDALRKHHGLFNRVAAAGKDICSWKSQYNV